MPVNFRNRKKLKRISILLCVLMLCMLTGCKSREDTEAGDKPVTLAPTDTPKPTRPVKEPDDSRVRDEDKDKEDDTITDEPLDVMKAPDIKDFSPIDMYIGEYAFDVGFDENLPFYERVFDIYGEYDLDGDGETDTIAAVLEHTSDTSILVNGISLEYAPMSPTEEIYIIDMDSRDNYKEIAIFDEGPSGDPTFIFIRYDGEELYSLPIDRGALMDGQGRFISWFDLSSDLTPQFFTAWQEVENNEFIRYENDITPYLGKTYEVNGTGFFVSVDENPEDLYDYMTWEFEEQIEFNAAKITLLDVKGSHCYYVEREDGERGLLYFWIGD